MGDTMLDAAAAVVSDEIARQLRATVRQGVDAVPGSPRLMLGGVAAVAARAVPDDAGPAVPETGIAPAAAARDDAAAVFTPSLPSVRPPDDAAPAPAEWSVGIAPPRALIPPVPTVTPAGDDAVHLPVGPGLRAWPDVAVMAADPAPNVYDDPLEGVAASPVEVPAEGAAPLPAAPHQPVRLSARAAPGREDTRLPLELALGHATEATRVTIAGLPPGARLSAGTEGPDGIWTLTAGEAAGVELIPGRDWSGEAALDIRVTSWDAMGRESRDGTVLPVTVSAVADAPDASAGAVSGLEDGAVALDLRAALGDADGSEVLGVVILGVPAGASLSAGTRAGDGSWRVAASDLQGLTLSPPANFAGDLRLTLRATATERTNGDVATRDVAFAVRVGVVVDGADLSAQASGVEDAAIPIRAAFGTSPDGSESWDPWAIVGGVPTGATLTHGTGLGGGAWRVGTEDLAAGRVAITPAADSDAPIALTIEARISDHDGAGAGRAVTAAFTVNVAAIADAPGAVAADAAGDEDAAIRLDLSAALRDVDGSETLSVAILGLPPGATLSAGVRDADGTWRVAPADLPDLTLTPPRDFAGDLALTLRVTATEREGGDAATTEAPFTLRVLPVVDGADLTASAVGSEDGVIPIIVRFGTSPDVSESWDDTAVIRGVPVGASLTVGTDLGGGAWRVATADLVAGNVAVRPPADSDAPIPLRIEARIIDGDGSGATRDLTAGVTVHVQGRADVPDTAATDAIGEEDRAIPLDVRAGLTDRDGSETLHVTILGLPDGAALSAGERGADGAWLVEAVDLPGLTLTPPRDFAGDIALTLRAVSTESAGDSAMRDVPFTVHVAPVMDGATLTASASGQEDVAIPVIATFGTSPDRSESWDPEAVVRGVPAGGTLGGGTDLGGGAWRVAVEELAAGRVTLTPPPNSDAAIPLTIEARITDRDGNGTSRDVTAAVTVAVRAVADAPAVGAATVAGTEDTAIALDLRAALTDTDGSETLSVAILGLPAGAALSAGTRGADGSWTVAAADLPALLLTPPANFSGTLNLTLRAMATEATGDTAMRDSRFTVEVAPHTEAGATLTASGNGAEDRWIPIVTRFVTPDADGSERLSDTMRIEGLPAGAALNIGAQVAPGVWSVPTADLLAGSVAVRPPADSDADLRLTITATLEDRTGAAMDARPLVATAEIRVAAVADAPVVAASDVAGNEDAAIRLNLSAGLSDRDGSETLAVAVLGVPDGASLSAGARWADGTWTVPVIALPTLSLTPPRDFAGDLRLTLRATATERDGGDAATTETTFTVRVAPVVDGATLAVTASGREDTSIPVVARFGTSPDPSESWEPTATVRGVPTGATLSSGTDLGGGAWRVDTAELAAGRVMITPPANSDTMIPLTVEARITDRGGAGAYRDVSAGVAVAIQAVADAPTASALNVAGAEDTAIRLNLSAALTDRDGSETLSVAILGLPTGATLSAGTRNADGSWSVVPADLPNLALTPPRDFAGDLNLALRATSTEARGGGTATTAVSFAVHVDARADTATVVASGDGAEDSWIPIRGTLAPTDSDGSERLGATITVSDVPSGATLNAGTLVSPGVWSVPRDLFEAGTLAIRAPANSDADIALRIAVTTTDGMDTATTTATAGIVVRAVADAPTVQVADARGNEDTPIRLAGLGGALTDTDGSEALSFTLSGVPSGAVLSAGTKNTDGTWTLTPAQLSIVSITPPANFSGSMNLTLTAVATEARDGAAPARTSASFVVGVDPIADAGTISGSVTANEDAAITVKPTFTTPDADGSETWSANSRISGVPVGGTLTRGAEVSAGVWDVSTADLRNGLVAVRPPADSDADFNLTVSATLTDTGNGLSASRAVTGTHKVTVRAVADAPIVTVANAAGAEDTPIPLALSARLTDADGSERLTLVIAGVPAGATLSAGTRNADGTWSVTAADLPTLSITPPRDFSGTMNLTLRATSADNDSSTATTAATFAVRVDAVADAPGLRVGPAAGAEDAAIGLRISGWTTDADGSERLVGFRVMDVPDGATLRAGGAVLTRGADGTFLVDAAAAPTLTVTPPIHSDRDFTLRVAAISEEPNGSRAESAAESVPVRVDAAADAPVWVRIGAGGSEDAAIPLSLAARLTDADGSERLSYVVSGLPAGALLSAGTYRGPGSWSLTAEEAANVAVTPPRDFAGTINLTVSAVAQEGDGGSQAVSTVSFPLRVTAVVDASPWSATFRGTEDSPIALNLTPPLRDLDGSERLVGDVVVEGIPPGATLRLADGSAVVVTNGTATIAAGRIGGVTLTAPHDSDEAVRLTVRATVEDTGGVQAEVRGTITADPRGVADVPSLQVEAVRVSGSARAEAQPSRLEDAGAVEVWPDGRQEVAEDGWARLTIAAAPADADGSESVHVWVRDVPRGFVLSAGVPAGDGAWLLRAEDLRDLQVRPPSDFAGEVVLRVVATSVEREGDMARAETKLVLAVERPRGNGEGSDRDSRDLRSQPPALRTEGGAADEDGPVPLTIRVESRDDDGGREILGIRVEGVPAGAALSAGIHDPERDAWVLRPDELEGLRVVPPADFAGDVTLRVTAIAVERNGDVTITEERATLHFEPVADAAAISSAPAAGFEDRAVALNLGVGTTDADGSEAIVSILLSGLSPGATIAPAAGVRDNGNGTWSVNAEAVGNVRLVPPANAHGTFGLTVTATTREGVNGDTETVSRGITVAVSPVADAPAAAAADVTGREDGPIALNLSASLRDTDGSENLSVVLSGFPEGARLSAGVNNGDGTWTLTPAQLPGLAVTPPRDWSGTMALTMSAHTMERSTAEVATTAVPFRVSVAGAADAPLVDAAAIASGAEDARIAVDIVARLTDADGSETLSVTVTGVPAGAGFSAGIANPDGSWTIPGAALPGLTLTPPPNYAGTLRLDFAATAREADGDAATVRFSTAVTVDAVADAPRLSLTGITTNEDTAIRLPLAASLTDTDGSEAIARYVVSGLPSGATLSAGTKGSDGAWTLTAAQATTVTVTPPANYSGTMMLSVTAVSREGSNGAEAAATATLPVTVLSAADSPVLTVANVSGAEDTAVPLNLSAALGDTDGSESFAAIQVAGLPNGFALSAGTSLGGGAWSLAPSQLPGLRMTAPADWNGSVALSLSATAQDGASTATTSKAFTVTVAPVNDAPVLSLVPAPRGATGQEVASVIRDATLSDVDSARMGGATITVSGGGSGEHLSFAGYALTTTNGVTMVGNTGITVTAGANGTVTLSGAATAATYERVLESLSLEAADAGAGLAAGTRSISVTLRDEAGAAAASQMVAITVAPSVVMGTGIDAALTGTAGHDTVIGSAGNEAMTGGAGADLFVVAMGGGHDRVDGGAGAWTDVIQVDGGTAPGAGAWTLQLDAGIATASADGQAFDLSQPATGHIAFADGGVVEFSGVERITW